MATPFRTRRRVEFVDTDMAGIVHFSNFFRWMEAAEVDLLQSLGLSVTMTWDGQHLSLPRVAASCDFVRPARFLDVLDIAVTITKVGRTSITYAHGFTRDGEPIARGQVSAVCCRVLPDGRIDSVEIPERVRQRLEGASG
jgi:YbgC/YbaW family acyl-CoA thioester hydrolase